MPTRFVIGLMVFLATTFAYMLSFNFSINLLAMVQSTGVANASLPDVSIWAGMGIGVV